MIGDHGLLYLHEEILLLALRGEGRAPSGSLHSYGLGGAVLAELLLHERVELESHRFGRRVRSTSPTQIGEPILDSALARIRTARRPFTLTTCVGKLAQIARPKTVAHRLHQRGILRIESRRFLLMFTLAAYPERDSERARRPIETLHELIFEGRETDERERALAAVARQAELLHPIFGKKAIKARKEKLDELTEGQPAGEATRSAIRRVRLAIAVGAAGGAVLGGFVVA